jgi:L-ribulose-5-phosphate 3-epimerase
VRFAYNSNGLKLHPASAAIELLAKLGYDGIELALQREHLDPLEVSGEAVAAIRELLRANRLAIVCGAGVPNALGEERFEPSLFHPDAEGRALRRRFLHASLEVAAELGSDILVFCTGAKQAEVDRSVAWAWLADGVADSCRRAAELGLRVALEPEPGHFVETVDDYRCLRAEIGQGDDLGIAVDIGHLHCTEDGPPQTHAAQLLDEEQLLHVQIDDMRDRRHEHLPLGEGQIDFPPIMQALAEGGYTGLVSVELSRHSERGDEMAAKSLEYLRAINASRLRQ